MSSADETTAQIDYGPDERPEFNLEYLIDVTTDPSKIIFLPTEGSDMTHWIIADSDDAIHLDAIQ